MTSLMNVSKNLIFEKWKLMNWVFGIDAIAVIGIYLLMLIKGQLNANNVMGTAVLSFGLVNFVVFILLSRSNEHILTSNNYRLIPVTDTKLYLGNILTTFAAFIYLQILEGVVEVIIAGASGQFNSTEYGIKGAIDFGTVIQILLLLVLMPLLLWSAITLIHLLISWIGGFVPFGSQKFVRFVLYLVVTWLGLTVFRIITGAIFKMISSTLSEGISSLSQFNTVTWLGLGVMFAWVVVVTLINIYLQKRWVETIR